MSRPDNIRKFVAFDRAEHRSVDADGSAVTLRAETFVEEYPRILIKDFGSPSDHGDGFATRLIEFDAKSASDKMKYSFKASTEVGSPIDKILEEAHTKGLHVYIAIETWRRAKTEGDGDPVDPQTPIRTLRGSTDESPGGQPQVTKANCRKTLAAAGLTDDPARTVFAAGKDAHSDPAEWPQLRGNRQITPPEGPWRLRMHDGKPAGGIIKVAGATPATAAAATQTVRPAGARGRVAEEAPYKPINTDGRPNLGSYVATKVRATYATTHEILTGLTEFDELPEADQRSHVRQLTLEIIDMATQVQQAVAGKVDLAASSHKEAGMWVCQTIRLHHHVDSDVLAGGDARTAWITRVTERATEDYEWTRSTLHQLLDIAEPEQNQQRTPEPKQQPKPGAADTAPAAPKADQAEREAIRTRYLQLMEAAKIDDPSIGKHFLLQQFGALGVRRGFIQEVPVKEMSERLSVWETDPARFGAAVRHAAQQAELAAAS